MFVADGDGEEKVHKEYGVNWNGGVEGVDCVWPEDFDLEGFLRSQEEQGKRLFV